MKKLIRMLQHAHAAEHGAIQAYEGHRASLKNLTEQRDLNRIIYEEVNHRNTVEWMLMDLSATPSKLRIAFFSIIGFVLGKLCHITGYKLPMHIAGLIEQLGRDGYREIQQEALRQGKPNMAEVLGELAKAEDAHALWFEERSKK